MSALEEKLLFAMRAVGLPEPVREHQPFRCCPHPKSRHKPTRVILGEEVAGTCGLCPAETWQHDYHAERRWAVDFAWPDQMLVVECEGGVFDGRAHGSVTGILRDIEKYNALTVAGWRVYRATQREINSGQALYDIERLLSAV